MNNDPILQAVAERNPVREIPPYDRAGEAGLRDLLSAFRTDTTRPVPRARTRRPVLVAAGVGGGLVVALVAGVLVSQHTPDPSRQHVASPPVHRSTGAPSSAGAQRFPHADAATPVELVVERSTTVLDSASDYILRATETTYGAHGVVDVSVSWEDERAPANTREVDNGDTGKPLADFVTYVEGGTITHREVNYQTHQYAQKSHSTAGTTLPSKNQATVMAQDLKAGNDKVIGTTVVDGRTVLHLSDNEPGMNREVWVDPTTYLPVRMTAHGSFGSYVIDYQWIPRNPANLLTLLRPSIPAGYPKVTRFSKH
jgi:hypothetical protein